MKNEKKKLFCYLMISLCFYEVSIMNFVGKDTTTGIIFLGAGTCFLCLATTYINKNSSKK